MISNDGFASYDDSGKAGHKSCYVLESGIYDFYVGNSVRTCEKVYSFTLESTVVTAELSEVMAVSENRAFERFAAVCNGDKIALSKEKSACSHRESEKSNTLFSCRTEKKSAVTKAISSPM